MQREGLSDAFQLQRFIPYILLHATQGSVTMPLDFLFAAKAIGTPIAEFLLKHFLGEPAAAAGKGLIAIAGKAIEDGATQYEAKLRFEELGHKIVKRLQPLFHSLPDNAAEAIARELGETLSQSLSIEFLVERDLDPAKLTAAFRSGRPLPHAVFGTDETALYDRALDEAARYLVGIANKLPRFEPTAAGAVLGRLSRMGNEIERILDGITRIEHAFTAAKDQAAARANRFESDYRQAVIRNLDFLELFGADISEEARRHRLSVGYISLTISAFGDGEMRETLNADRLFGTLATGSGRLLIRGEAGSGKSTLLRWAAIENASVRASSWLDRINWVDLAQYTADPNATFATGLSSLLKRQSGALSLSSLALVSSSSFVWTESFASALKSWTTSHVTPMQNTLSWLSRSGPESLGRVPFLVRLRDCPNGKLPSPDELPVQIARELGNPPGEWVQSVLDAGRGLLLLDGVDEVPNSKREDTRSGIRAIVHQYPKCWYVVTTRPTAVRLGWLRAEEFGEAEINPLSDTDRTELICRWHRAVEDELSRQGRPEDLRQLGDHLIGMLAENPALARLATNPLLCAVMCALHRDRRQVLPESQGELCEAICQLLLHRREAEAGIPLAGFPGEYTALKYKQKRAILQMIAHHMVDNEESTIAEDDAITCTSRTLRHFPSIDEASAGMVLKALIERSGMLRERRQGVIDFVHNTLRDFLSAEVFVENSDIPKLARHAADDSWREVVRFAASTDNRTFATKLVKRILDDAEKVVTPEVSRRLRLAAVDCRYAALNMEPSMVKRVTEIERTLVPPQTMADAEALAASGDAVVPLLHYREMNEECAAASVRALRLVGTEYAQRVLSGYFADRRPSVVDELSQAVNPLLLDLVRDQLRVNGKLNDAIARRVTDLRPLSQMLDLEYLDLSSCVAIQDISPLRALRNLKSLDLPIRKISDVSPVFALSSLARLALNSPDASDLTWLSDCEALRYLVVSEIGDAELQALGRLSRLEAVEITDAKADQWAELGKLGNLRNVHLVRSGVVRSFEWLTGLSNLKVLSLHSCEYDDPTPIGRLRTLGSLTFSGTSVNALPSFDDQAALSELRIFDASVSDLSPIRNLPELRTLLIFTAPVSDLEPISNLRALERLAVSCTSVKDLEPLAGLPNLKFLNIGGTLVKDLRALESFTKLETLNMNETPVSDLRPLRGLCELKTLWLQSIAQADIEVLMGLPELKHIIIDRAVSEEILRPLFERGISVAPAPRGSAP
jgi:Leucine-rich repeat (LRR) protein